MQKPSEPKKYKWVVLGGLFLIYMASNGITMHTLPLLYPELVDHFGWSAAQVTLPATIFFIIGAITSPPAGWLLDRFSPRRIILVGSVILFCDLIIYGKVTALWELVLVYAVLGVGLSMSGLVSNMVVLSGWFDESRGRATGILLMASSLGGAVFPPASGQEFIACRLARYGHDYGGRNWLVDGAQYNFITQRSKKAIADRHRKHRGQGYKCRYGPIADKCIA